MSGLHALAELVDLTSALYRAEQARMRELNETERKLRSAMARLEDSRKSSLALPAKQLHPLRQIGADILWQGWIGRNREDLNRQLALCLAQKARMMAGLRRAYGKHIAAQDLLDQEKATLRQAKNRKAINQDQILTVLRTSEG